MKSLPASLVNVEETLVWGSHLLSSTVIVPSKSVKKISLGLVSMYGRAWDPILAILNNQSNKPVEEVREINDRVQELPELPLDR